MSPVLLDDSGCPLSLVSDPPESYVRLLTGLPSTIINGSWLPEIVPVPLILKNAFVPASPLVFLISNPGTFHRNEVIMFTSPALTTASPFTDSIETPSFSLYCLAPIPVTTMDSKSKTSLFN